MPLQSSTCAAAVALAVALTTLGGAQAADLKYPDWKGAWARWVPANAARDPGNGGTGFTAGGQPSFDQTKPWGLGQQAPLTPEYQAILEASIADQAKGGQGNWNSGARCLPPGMPATMNGYNSLEFVALPEITYVLVEHNLPIQRRIYTDGRDWPTDVEPSFQ